MLGDSESRFPMTSLVANGNAHSGIIDSIANPLMRVKPYVCAEGSLGAFHFLKLLPGTSAPPIARFVSLRVYRHDRDHVGSSADGGPTGVNFLRNALPRSSVRLRGQAARQRFQPLDLLPQFLNLRVLRL